MDYFLATIDIKLREEKYRNKLKRSSFLTLHVRLY